MSAPQRAGWGPALPAAAILALLLCLQVGIARSTRQLVTFSPQFDEGYYLRYAGWVAEEGPAAFPRLFEEYIRDGAERTFFPGPARVLPILGGAVAIRLWGPGYQSLAWMSLGALLFLVAVMFLGVRRWFGDTVSLWAGLLFAAAPLHLLLARRAITDTLVSAAVLSCFWLVGWALGIGGAPGRPRRWWAVAAGFTAAFLVKESAVVLVPVSLALIAWHSAVRRKFSGWRAVACVSVIPGCAAAAVAAAAAGGIGTLCEEISVALRPGLSGTAAMLLRGPWFRYVVDLLLISPWTTILFFCWLGLVLAGHIREEEALFWTLVPVLFIAFALFHPIRDVRFIMPVEMPMRLGVALFLQRVFLKEARGPLLGMAVVAALVAVDLQAFGRFAQADLLEPANLYLLRADGFLPFIPGG